MKYNKIIFISGWGAGKEVWDSIQTAFKSDLKFEYISWSESLGNTLETNSAFNVLSSQDEPVILVGWSLGGMVALNAAANFPEKVAGLVLISTSARMIEDTEYAGVNKLVIKAMKLRLKTDKIGLLSDFANMGMFPGKDELITSQFVDNALEVEGEELAGGLSFLMNSDFRLQLSKLKMPVKIVHGKFDQIMKLDNAVYLNDNLVNSTLNAVNREGHFLVQRKPQIIINSINEIVNA